MQAVVEVGGKAGSFHLRTLDEGTDGGHGTDLRLDGQKVPGAAFLLDSGAAEARIRKRG